MLSVHVYADLSVLAKVITLRGWSYCYYFLVLEIESHLATALTLLFNRLNL